LERELVRAVLANEALIALTGYDRDARIALLDRAAARLTQQQCRIVRVCSNGGQPLDLKSAMNQVVGPGSGGAERVERFFDTIALPVGDERRIVLVLDDAELLTSDLLSYLALIGPTTVGQDLCLQIVVAGDPTMWDRLPRSGNLASDRIDTRLVVGVPVALGQPLPKFEPPPEPSPPPRLLPAMRTKQAHRLPPPTEGHEGLRHRMAQRERQRQRRYIFTSRVAIKLASAIFTIVIVVGTAVLWAKLPELRTTVRQWIGPEPVVAASPSSAIAALVARGNWLLSHGDVASAQAVFQHAAMAGSASGATGLAKTYDPLYLADVGAHGAIADATIATDLYRQAAVMGDSEAAERLARLQASLGR
jgi:hypothetical protein